MLWHQFDAKLHMQNKSFKLIANMGKHKQCHKILTIYLRCWLVTLTAIRICDFLIGFANWEWWKGSTRCSIWPIRATKEEKGDGKFEWEIEKRERDTENALNCGHQVKTKALVRKIKWSDFLKPQIKISNIVHFKDLVHSAKFKLVVIWYRSCEPNWFSWSANIYTCMAFYTNL